MGASRPLGMQAAPRYFLAQPTAPGNNATVILAATAAKQPGGSGAIVQPPPHMEKLRGRATAVTITFLAHDQASAANGIRVYAKDAAGTWRESDRKNDSDVATIGSAAPVQIPVLSSPAEKRVTIIVADLDDWAIEYTAGATGPTATTGWQLKISVEVDDLAVIR